MIVAKAWTDPEFKQALLSTGREALREMGVHQGKVGKLVVVENTDKVHNVIVCTLCSCYPYDILGDTPWWYKHESYRTKIVQNPRACIKEMFELGTFPPVRKFRFTTARPTCVILFCRNALPARKGWRKKS